MVFVSYSPIDVNKIFSTYEIDSADSLQDAFDMEADGDTNGGIFYWNKEKATKLAISEAARLTVSNIDGFNPRITGNNAIVKSDFESQTNTRQFKKWFGKSVITENGEPGGTPIVMYHGTNKQFTVFNKGDIGFHFGTKDAAESRMEDMDYGDDGILMPVYLRIRIRRQQNGIHTGYKR